MPVDYCFGLITLHYTIHLVSFTNFHICLQNFEFNLGFGVKTTSPKEAGELLMEREYPQILKSATTPHDAIFIPEVYLYGSATETVKYFIFNLQYYSQIAFQKVWLYKRC
jgi:hypothetical protein